MTHLLLIRHAANDYVEEQRLAGWTPGVHLNEPGRRQAESLAQRLSGVPLATVISSPLERARETAAFITTPHRLEVNVNPDLGEVRYGDWTGQPLEELAKTDLWRTVQIYPSKVRFPGGEALYEVQNRVVGALERISATYPEDIVAVVAHADVIKLAVAYFVGMPLDLYQRLIIAPASLTVLQNGPLTSRLITLNDTSHLEDRPEMPSPEPGQKQKGATRARANSA